MKLLYLHGLGSGPDGFKPTWLREAGYEVIAPELPDDDIAASVQIARRSFEAHAFDVVVGSSRGGAVALAIDTGKTPRVLIAPAWRRLGIQPVAGPKTILLHSPFDDLVPLQDSRDLAVLLQLPIAAIIEVGDRHSMTDPGALAALVQAIEHVTSESTSLASD